MREIGDLLLSGTHRMMLRSSALLIALAVTACAGPVKYAPQPEIALVPASLDVAREVNRKVEDALAFDGDFHPNDLVRLSFPYFPLLGSDQRVQLSGMISPPLLGPVQTKGLTAEQLQAQLTRAYQPKLAKPSVSVQILEYNRPPPTPEVFVLGEVTKPGNYPYRDGTSIFEGLARAGGGNRDADLRRVVLLSPRGGQMTARMVDLEAVLQGERGSTEFLSPFSILIVPPTGIARDVDRARQIRQIIGFNGVNVGSAITLIQP